MAGTEGFREAFDRLYRDESRHVLATLIRLIGDFDAAEEALHEAFAAAASPWPGEGVPQNPRAWLISNHPGIAMGRWEIRAAGDLDPLVKESQRRRAAKKQPALRIDRGVRGLVY